MVRLSPPRPDDVREMPPPRIPVPRTVESEPVEPEPGMAGRLAHLTQNAPFLSFLGGLSPTYAIRWLLWLFAVLGSLIGLCLVIIGTLSGLLVLGPLSSSAQAILSDASATTLSAAGGVDAAMPLSSAMATVTNSTADSLLNLTVGLNSMGNSLQGLSNIGGIDTGLGTSAAAMHGAAASLGPAITTLQGAGSSANDASARMTEVGDSLRRASADLDTARQSVGVSVFYAQVGIAAFGLALAALLTGVFCLAVAYGPPKKS